MTQPRERPAKVQMTPLAGLLYIVLLAVSFPVIVSVWAASVLVMRFVW